MAKRTKKTDRTLRCSAGVHRKYIRFVKAKHGQAYGNIQGETEAAILAWIEKETDK